MDFTGELKAGERATTVGRCTRKLTGSNKISAANMREQTALFKLARKSAEVTCLKEDLEVADLENASANPFKRTLLRVFNTDEKSLPKKVLSVKRLIQKTVYKSILGPDGCLQTVWKPGPTARLAVTPKQLFKTGCKKKVTKSQSSKPISLGPWRTLGFIWETNIPLKNIPKVSKIAERKILLSGVDRINVLINKLHVKREISLAKLEGGRDRHRNPNNNAVAKTNRRKIVTACYSKVPTLSPFIAKIFEDLINEQQYKTPPWAKDGCVYFKTAVDKCDLGTHFVSQVVSSNGYQNPQRLHIFGDLKAPASDTVSNHKYILDSYYDEIDGFHRGGIVITFTVHHEEYPVSHSCVLLLHKAYRIKRAVKQEIARKLDEIKTDEDIKRNDREEKLYCHCREPYNATRNMIECTNCKEWYHPECLKLSGSILKEYQDSD